MESAKRRTPTVKPVIHDGVRYEPLRRAREHGFKQSGGVIAAFDVVTDKMLWAVQLYQTNFDDEERDVQEIYVTELKLDAKAGALLAVDERKRRWQVRLSDHSVTEVLTATSK